MSIPASADKNQSNAQASAAATAAPVTSDDIPKVFAKLKQQYESEAKFVPFETTSTNPTMILSKACESFVKKNEKLFAFEITGSFPASLAECKSSFLDTTFLQKMDPSLLSYNLMSQVDDLSGFYYLVMSNPLPFCSDLEIVKLRCIDESNNKVCIYTSSNFVDPESEANYRKRNNPKNEKRSLVKDILSCLELTQGVSRVHNNPAKTQPVTNFRFIAFLYLPSPLNHLSTERIARVAQEKLQLGVDYFLRRLR